MPKHRFSSKAVLPIVVGLVLVAGAALLVASHLQPHRLVVNGQQLVLRGRYATVTDLVEAAGITIRPEDHVSPDLTTPPPVEGAVVILEAHPVDLTIDGQTSTIWTHQASLASFLAENGVEIKPTSIIQVDHDMIGFDALGDARLGRSVQILNEKIVVIKDNGNEITLKTVAFTVGQALIEAGVDFFAADQIEPAPASWLYPGQEIVIERAAPMNINLDESQIAVRTSHGRVADILAEAGVSMIGLDRSSPALDGDVREGETMSISRHEASYLLTETPVPYTTRFQPLETLEIDQRSLVQAGSTGLSAHLARVDLSESSPVSGTVVGEWISVAPTDEIIGYGTNIVVRTIDTPEGPLSYWRVVRMRVSAYTPGSTGKPPGHPAYGITASGRPAGYGVVAIDPNVVPFRSQVYVPGYGVAFAGDTGGAVRGRWIDLGYDEGEIETWSGYVDVYYLTPVPDPENINYLIPSTLP